MRTAEVFCHGVLAGILIEENRHSYIFKYTNEYYLDNSKPAISLTLPKVKQEYRNELLFPFFSNMIAEGANLDIQSKYLKIDKKDALALLGATASIDSIGAVTVKLNGKT